MTGIKLEQELVVNINGKKYYAELADIDQPNMETEDHGFFIFSALCNFGGGSQGIQVILDNPRYDKDGKFIGRFLDEHSCNFIMAYLNFWGKSFQRAYGDAFVLREDHDGYIKGLMSKDMKKSIIFSDYFPKE